MSKMATLNKRTNVELDRSVLEHKLDPKKFFLQWEWLLVIILVVILIINGSISDYFRGTQVLDATMNFMDKGFMVLAMVFVILLGEIDISVGSTAALCSVIMAIAYNAGMPMELSMVLCLAVGLGCGYINGILIAKCKELPSMIITLATMTIYRGIAYIILEDQASGGFPEWFQYLSWGYVGPIPFSLLMFIILAAVFGLLLHKSVFGRQVYAMGNNETTSRYSGIKVNRNKIIIFTLMGLMAGACALFLTSRMASTRPNVAQGYELDVIAMVVLGGVSTAGGKGNMLGAILAVFIVGYLRYGLGLINISAQVMMIIIGLLLIGSVLASNFLLNKPKALPKK